MVEGDGGGRRAGEHKHIQQLLRLRRRLLRAFFSSFVRRQRTLAAACPRIWRQWSCVERRECGQGLRGAHTQNPLQVLDGVFGVRRTSLACSAVRKSDRKGGGVWLKGEGRREKGSGMKKSMEQGVSVYCGFQPLTKLQRLATPISRISSS